MDKLNKIKLHPLGNTPTLTYYHRKQLHTQKKNPTSAYHHHLSKIDAFPEQESIGEKYAVIENTDDLPHTRDLPYRYLIKIHHALNYITCIYNNEGIFRSGEIKRYTGPFES